MITAQQGIVEKFVFKKLAAKKSVCKQTSSEFLTELQEFQKSVRMQLVSLLMLISIAAVLFFCLEWVYITSSYKDEVTRLGLEAQHNAQVLSENINMSEIVAVLKDPDANKQQGLRISEKFNLYNAVLGSEYVYVMLSNNQEMAGAVHFTPVAAPEMRGSILRKSTHPMRMAFINGYPEAFNDNAFWDDVTDYTKPGPLETMSTGKPTASITTSAHPRWGNLISGQAPLYYKGEIVGFLGVDYSTDKVLLQVEKSWRDLGSLLILVATILLTVRTVAMGHLNALIIRKIVRRNYEISGIFVLNRREKDV